MTKLATTASATIPVLAPSSAVATRSILSSVPRLFAITISLALLFAPALIFDPSKGPDRYWLGRTANFMALGVMALSIDLVWGYTGLLTLGQGLFFGLGAYMMAYCLTLQKAAAANGVAVGMAPPQFMAYTGPAPNDPSYVVPPALSIIAPLGNTWLAITMAILLPLVVATLFGYVIFRCRIRGVYFSLVTQTLLLAVFILVRNQQRFTGGVVGIKDLAQLHLFDWVFGPNALLDPSTGRPVVDPVTEEVSYQPMLNLNFLAAGVLVSCLLLCAWLVRTKFGKILTAIRDNENRILALGYNTAMYKTFIFALAGALAGLSGALYVVANDVCDSKYLSVGDSIEAVIWVAVGGRGTLLGAPVGAILVGFGGTTISSAVPELWPIILGLLFVVVVLFLPRGLVPKAGSGALLGLMIGVISVNYMAQSLWPKLSGATMSREWRAGVAVPVMLLVMFLPKIISLLCQLTLRILRYLLRFSGMMRTKPIGEGAGS